MGGADNGKCTIWKKFDDDGNELDSEKVCIDEDADSNGGYSNGMPGTNYGPASSNNNPNNYGNENIDPFKNPYAPPNVAPPTEPTPQGFYNPVTSKAAALGGGPDAAPSFTKPDWQKKGFKNLDAPDAQDGDLGEDNACYYIIFDCGSASPGPKLEGKLRFYDNKSSEEVASFDAVAGNDNPVHYAPPYGTKFTLTKFHSPSLGNTRVFGLGQTISFRADLDPERLTDPQSGNEAGPFFIFPLSQDSTGTKGAIGIKGQYKELKKAQEMLKAACKCHATLKIGLTDAKAGYAPPPPPPDAVKKDKPQVNVANKLPALGIPEFGQPKNKVIDKKAIDKDNVLSPPRDKQYIIKPSAYIHEIKPLYQIKECPDIDFISIYRKFKEAVDRRDRNNNWSAGDVTKISEDIVKIMQIDRICNIIKPRGTNELGQNQFFNPKTTDGLPVFESKSLVVEISIGDLQQAAYSETGFFNFILGVAHEYIHIWQMHELKLPFLIFHDEREMIAHVFNLLPNYFIKYYQEVNKHPFYKTITNCFPNLNADFQLVSGYTSKFLQFYNALSPANKAKYQEFYDKVMQNYTDLALGHY